MAVKRKRKRKATPAQLRALAKGRAKRKKMLAKKRKSPVKKKRSAKSTSRKKVTRRRAKTAKRRVANPRRKLTKRRRISSRRRRRVASYFYVIQGRSDSKSGYNYYFLRGNEFVKELAHATKHKTEALCLKRMHAIKERLPSAIRAIWCTKVQNVRG